MDLSCNLTPTEDELNPSKRRKIESSDTPNVFEPPVVEGLEVGMEVGGVVQSVIADTTSNDYGLLFFKFLFLNS